MTVAVVVFVGNRLTVGERFLVIFGGGAVAYAILIGFTATAIAERSDRRLEAIQRLLERIETHLKP